MASYKSAPVWDYDQGFQDVARDVFVRVSARLPGQHATERKGSWSFIVADETIAKIEIFQHGLGMEMQGQLPWRNEGVYVLIRTNGEFADRLWNETIPQHPRFSARVARDGNVGTAPNYDRRFAYFPIMAGENLDEIAAFLTSLVQCALQPPAQAA